MTPEEIICQWMDPDRLSGKWWFWFNTREEPLEKAHAAKLNLDALHEVEARLSDEQWWQYEKMVRSIPFDQFVDNAIRCALHASAEDKIKALGPILLPEVLARMKITTLPAMCTHAGVVSQAECPYCHEAAVLREVKKCE